MHDGHVHLRDVAKQAAEAAAVGGLRGVVQLAVQAGAPLVQQLRQVRVGLEVAAQRARQPAQDEEVQRDALVHAWPLHLHRHHLPRALERPLVHLPQAGSRQRLGRQAVKDVAGGAAVLLRHQRQRVLRGEARDLVVQLLQLLEVAGRQQVGARRNRLADLHKRGAQASEHLPEPRRRGAVDGRQLVVAHACNVAAALQPGRHPPAPKHAAYLHQAVAHRRGPRGPVRRVLLWIVVRAHIPLVTALLRLGSR
mmetsp:Transcript_16039/g.41657  ORF Transcript_16039/g.41657 Transcript_16039/m.41657 type:complete len:252 (+) Transcript_16039:1784-2539(+)